MEDYEQNDTSNTPLQKFYSGQTVFITGSTGFLGKVLIEKLFRCCPCISRIYILIRAKKGKNIEERIQYLHSNTIFASEKNNLTTFTKKIIGIQGDINLPQLGLRDTDRALLKEEVSIVFHVAATVRFDEKLKQAVISNVQSTASILELCKDMKNLKSLVHVSTAYSNCFVKRIEEKFYDYSLKSDDLLNLVNSLPEDIINNITPQLTKSWPNTYTFTKALAEDLVRSKSKDLPVGIFRPGMVTSIAKEPIPGWTDSYNGPLGLNAGMATGLIRTVHCDPDMIPNFVPVDLTVNAMIACAWDIASQTDKRNEDMLIYNFTSTEESPISCGTFCSIFLQYTHRYPSKATYWYSFLILSKFKLVFRIYALFLHWIPAYLVDFASHATRQKPRLVKVYENLHKMMDLVSTFCLNGWSFKNTNVQNLWNRLDSRDQEIFWFTFKNFDWHSYLHSYTKGIRIYLLKDDLKSLEKSKLKYKWLYWTHCWVSISIMFLGCMSLYRLISFLR